MSAHALAESPPDPVPAMRFQDYSLVGRDSRLAVEKGLADADWYVSPVPKDRMRELFVRRDWPAIRDSILFYEIASFMVLRESVPWRWSHARHHSDTIIVGRDPEIAVPRPPDIRAMLLKLINFNAFTGT